MVFTRRRNAPRAAARAAPRPAAAPRQAAPQRKPLFTVAMISYNGAKLIGEAVDSLLAQTDSGFEVVMVDDCSTDSTPQKMEEARDRFELLGIRCRIFRNERNRGTGYSWNRAASMAETEWVLFLADDDLYMPERVEMVRKFIAEHPETEWLHHDVIIWREATGERTLHVAPSFNDGAKSMRLFFERALANVFVVHNSVAIRKSVFDAVGGIRDLRGVEDFDFWMRLVENGHLPLKMDGPPLLTYRSRGLDVSRFPYQSYYGAFAQVMNDFLDRYAKRQDADPEAVKLARKFRIGVYIAYSMRCAKRGNVVLAAKALGGMAQRDFSIGQFAGMAAEKVGRVFKGEN